MEEVLITSSSLTLTFAVIAIVCVLLVLRIFDVLTGAPFSSTREKIREDSKAAAVYYGLRFLGVCMLVGQLFS